MGWCVAWSATWLGDLDPTNGIVVRDEHVMLGWGRDYSDVAPLIGVILGGGKQTLSVECRRLVATLVDAGIPREAHDNTLCPAPDRI